MAKNSRLTATKPSTILVFGTIILLSIMVRFYRLSDFHTFHNDEGRDALIAYSLAFDHSPTLLGPQTSVGNMYLGPLYYYLIAPALLLSGGDPVGPAALIAATGVLTTLGVMGLAYRRWGILATIIAGTTMAISPVFVHYTKSSWNPNLLPFVALLVILAYRRRLVFVLGLLFGVIFQLHYVAMLFALYWGLLVLVESKTKLLDLGKLILGFFLSTLPFWLFELRHNFLNLSAFVAYLTAKQNEPSTSPYFSRLFENTQALVQDLVWSNPFTHNTTPTILPFLTYALFLVVGITLFRQPQKLLLRLMLLLGFSLLGTSILREAIHPHYVAYLFPVVALLLASLSQTHSRVLKLLVVSHFVLWIIYSLPVTVASLRGESSHQKLKAQEVAGFIMRDSQGEPYNVVASADNSRETTYLYYLWRLPSPPTREPVRLLYLICEDRPCTSRDLNDPALFARGPAHPALEPYLAHPYTPISTSQKNLTALTHTVYGVWVARVIVGE